MEDSKTILEIERLVKAQADHALTVKIPLSDGSERIYSIASGPNGLTVGSEIEPPSPALLSVSTLTGLLDAIKSGAAGDMAKNVVHVENYLAVSVKPAATNFYGDRTTLITAKHQPIDAFKFDEYYSDPAKFLIGLQVAFLQTEELLYLIKVASNLKAGNSVQTTDDGFSQTITLKAGEVSTAEVKIKPRIKLIPIRTFSEASPVESEFLIRFKQTPDQTPSIALFNVDGSKWQGETMQSIKKYLTANLPESTPILA